MEYTDEYIAHIREIRQLKKVLRDLQNKMTEARKKNDVKYHKYLGQVLELDNYINMLQNLG